MVQGMSGFRDFFVRGLGLRAFGGNGMPFPEGLRATPS